MTTWDFRTVPHESSSFEKILVFFFLAAGIVAATQLIRIWRAAPPFRLPLQAGNLLLVSQLETGIRSLTQWMRLTALLCAFLACCEFKRESTGFLFSAKTSSADVVYLLQNLSSI
jgi:hypothetical protein